MLYPINTDSRTVIDLSGIWELKFEEADEEINLKQPLKSTQPVAVPGSYNDQVMEQELRTYVGNIWYETTFYVPKILQQERLVLRFGSVTHAAKVYINGEFAVEHQGGFTPFEVEVDALIGEGKNRLTVCVDNIIDHTTLPVGNYTEEVIDGQVIKKVSENFDFFNYAGIHRPVKLYSTPKSYLKDLEITYDANAEEAEVSVKSYIEGNYEDISIHIFDEENKEIASASGEEATLLIKDVKLWEPLNSYLYTARITVKSESEMDTYELPFGIRTVEVKGEEFLINGKPFYFKGFGKHEDTYVHGRGLNEPTNVLDINLMKEMGANSFRTSHYPYSEEMMRLADREGIVVIDEVPAVSIYSDFNVEFEGETPNTYEVMDTKEAHEQVLKEMIKRDKNHACVVMWSVANEPATHHLGAKEYFEPLIELTRSLDPQHRPVTIVYNSEALPQDDLTYNLLDVICLNRYYGWYWQTGDLKAGEKALREEMKVWENIDLDKPFMFTEYGADTIPGLHSIYDIPFTEEYQVNLYEMYHKIFDEFDFIVGEQVWNFADFETKVGTGRVQGNKKGIFNRAREPKMIAHILKNRWKSIPDYGYKPLTEKD